MKYTLKLLNMVFFLSTLPFAIQGQECVWLRDFAVPIIYDGYGPSPVEFFGELVSINWNKASKIRTPTKIQPDDLNKRPTVMPEIENEVEAIKNTIALIDGYPEIFGIASSDLGDFRVHSIPAHPVVGGAVWTMFAPQVYQGIEVVGGFFEIVVGQNGVLSRMWGRLYHPSGLTDFTIQPNIDSEGAKQITLNAEGKGEIASEPQLYVAFRCEKPILMWNTMIKTIWQPVPESNLERTWSYKINAHTGEILDISSGGLQHESKSVFVRGDSNLDNSVDVSDAIGTLESLFLGKGAVLCEDAADTNDDGYLDQSDAVYSLTFQFLGGVTIPLPGPFTCGYDQTADALACGIQPSCR